MHTASHQARCAHTHSFTLGQVCSHLQLHTRPDVITSTATHQVRCVHNSLQKKSLQHPHHPKSYTLHQVFHCPQAFFKAGSKTCHHDEHDETVNPKHRKAESRVLKPLWVFSGDPWVLTKLSSPVLTFSHWTPIFAQTSFYLSPIVQFYPCVNTPNLINTPYQKRYMCFLARPYAYQCLQLNFGMPLTHLYILKRADTTVYSC